MSGNAAIRGYLLQTIICLLDSLDIENKWDSIILEPIISSDKVDILFIYKDKKKVIQVKSSQNQIGLSNAKKWAEELKNSISSDEYELILIGSTSQSVIDLNEHDAVVIKPPKVLDITSLIEQAAHKLDVYLNSNGYSSVPPFIREEFVYSIVTKLESYSTNGQQVSRSDFNKLLNNWILLIYPNSVNTFFSMQCDVVNDTIVFLPIEPQERKSFPIMLPLVFVNDGSRTSIIEWVAIKIITESAIKFYTPIAFIDYEKFIQGRRIVHSENIISQFSEFAILSKGAKEYCILFTQELNDTQYPFSNWVEGDYIFKIFVKYRDQEYAKVQKEFKMNVTNRLINDCMTGNSIANSIRKIVI